MHSSHQSSVVFNHLSLTWPDGSLALSDITGAFSTGKTGLIGANGSGKSTLLKLIDGQLKPTRGTVETAGRVGTLPQELLWCPGALVADVLNIAEPLNALKAIENGSINPADYDALDGQWDIQARAKSALAHLGISSIGLDRRAETLSGGELMLAALAGLHLAECDIVLLDEPTNNLDLRARHLLYEALGEWKGTVIIASHDVALLELMGQTAEIYQGSLRVHGDNYSSFRQVVAQEQAGAEQELRTARQKQKVEERQRQEAQTKLARRRRYADKDFENKRRPKTIMKQRGTEAQVSAGKLRGIHETRTSTAATAAQHARDALRDDSSVRIQLPDPNVPNSKRLLELCNADQVVAELRGPRKIALLGANGVGKSQMIKRLVTGGSPAKSAQLRVFTDRIGYLPQRLVFEDEQLSALDFVKLCAPNQPLEKMQAQLARFLMGGSSMNRELKVLSGGERFRVKLASLLLAEPAHQLLILDEPTNNLDVETVDALVSSLNGYCGGVIVVSHDEAFLNRLNIRIWAELTEAGFKMNAA